MVSILKTPTCSLPLPKHHPTHLQWHTGIPWYFIAHGWRFTPMVSRCIQDLQSKYKISRILHDNRLITKLPQLSQPFLSNSYLCAEVCRYKVCRWEAEIPLNVFFGIRVEAHIKCPVDACEHYRSTLNRYICYSTMEWNKTLPVWDKSNLLFGQTQYCC